MTSSNKPEPLNLLSLDGGGVRGVSELVILDRIMHRLQEKEGLEDLPRPCDYFDLIAGTSTGGLIAIMLGRLQMTTKEALDAYDQVAKDIFCFSNKKAWKVKAGFKTFKATPLRTAVQKMVAERSTTDLMHNPDSTQKKGKAFVCALEAENLSVVHRFRTYDTEDGADQWLKDCKVWEAARATTAAPVYFKAQAITAGSTTKGFVDAAIGYNNPTDELLDEAGRVFHRRRKIGVILSLGTGSRLQRLAKPADVGHHTSLWGGIKAVKGAGVDTEKVHQTVHAIFEKFPSTYFRFNVPGGAENVGLADWYKMSQLKELTAEYIRQEAVQQEIEDIVEVISKKKTADLTIGHVCSLDKGQLLMDCHKAQRMGCSSEFFTGRTAILRSLEDHFSTAGPGQERRQFLLCGMGGAGKTQIALKFVETRTKSRCFWIDATDPFTAQQGFEEIASEAFPDKQPTSVSMEEVQQWMAALDEPWLLVLDNSNGTHLSSLIPSGKTGNILYTSRDRSLASSLSPSSIAEVDDMEPDDAITMLLLTAGHAIAYNQELRAEACPVVMALGCLPLAIDQAGAYIRNMKQSMSEYLSLFKRQREALLRNPRFKGADARNQAVYATFDISYNALHNIMAENDGRFEGEDARNALNILRLICFYHNDSVMVDMFRRAALARHKTNRQYEHPLGRGQNRVYNLLFVRDSVWVSEPFIFGVMLLEKFSLAKRDITGQDISMHVLVHSWARDSIDKRDQLYRARCARAILFESIPRSSKPEDVRFRRRIAPHVYACLEHADVQDEHDGISAEYKTKLGLIYQRNKEFDKAEAALQAAVNLMAHHGGRESEDTLCVMKILAKFYQDMGRLGEAELILLEIIERWQGKIKDLELSLESRELRNSSHSTGRTDSKRDKEANDKRKLDAQDSENIKNLQLKIASCHFDLSTLYTAQNTWDRAELALLQCLEIRGEFAPDKPELCASANRSLKGLREFLAGSVKPPVSVDEAERLLKAAIEKHGEHHGGTLRARHNVVRAELAAGNLPNASKLALDYFHRCQVEYGDDDRKTLQALFQIGEVYSAEEQHIVAEHYYRETLGLFRREYGEFDKDTLKCLLPLAGSIALQGRYDEGLAIIKSTIEIENARPGGSQDLVTGLKAGLEDFEANYPRMNSTNVTMMAREALDKWCELLGQDPWSDEDVMRHAMFNQIARYWDEDSLAEKFYLEKAGWPKPDSINSFFQEDFEDKRRRSQQSRLQPEQPPEQGASAEEFT